MWILDALSTFLNKDMGWRFHGRVGGLLERNNCYHKMLNVFSLSVYKENNGSPSVGETAIYKKMFSYLSQQNVTSFLHLNILKYYMDLQ